MPSSAAIAPRYRVLIVDDHAIVRAGLRQLIDSDSAFLVTAEASTAAQAMHHLRSGDIDVMLLDIALPDRNGLDLLKQIKPMTPRLKVLVCSLHQEGAYGLRALRAGAAGYVSKQAMPNVMLDALHHIAAGKKYISDELAQQLAERIDDEQAWLPHQKLSDREYQTLLSIAAGMTVTEIATQLALSSKTISMYRTRLLQKMRMRNNAELMHYVIYNQLPPALVT
jgi:DNA-binding NarL/FixJ family response regulator